MLRLSFSAFFVLAACSIAIPSLAAGRQTKETGAAAVQNVLVPGQPVEHKLSPGETHRYTINLDADQYCQVTLVSNGSVAMAAYAPNGEELSEIGPDDIADGGYISIVAERSGAYSVKVRSNQEKDAASYMMTAGILREATPQDRQSAEARKCFLEAEQLRSHGTKESYLAAIKKYEQALGGWRSASDESGQAEALFQLGGVRLNLASSKDALEDFQSALRLAISSGRRRLARHLCDQIGATYTSLSQYGEALGYLNRSLVESRSAGDRWTEAEALDSIGVVYSKQSQNQKALEYYDQALALNRALGDRAGEATTLSDIGLAYNGLSQYDKALEYYNQALPISQGARDRAQQARILNNMGLAYYRLSEYEKAIESLGKSLPIRREIGDRSGEAITLSNFGLIWRATSQYEKAIDYYSEALPILHDIGNRASEAVTLSNLGVAYARLRQYEKALDCFNRSLPVSHEVGNKTQEASTLNNIGLVQTELGQYEKALDYYEQSLSIQRAIGDRMQESGTLDNIGVIQQRLGHAGEALDYYNRSLPISRAVGNRVDESMALTNLGFLYTNLRQYQKAQEYFGESLPITRKIGDRFGQFRTLGGMAVAYRATGSLAQARSAIEQSLAISESIRSEVSRDQFRAAYFASSHERFDFYISLLMEMYAKNPDPALAAAALEASERSRARTLLDLMAMSRVDIDEGVAPALKAREQAGYARLSQIQSELIRANSRLAPDASRISTLEAQLAAADEDRERIEAALRRSNPRYTELKYPTPLGAQGIQKLVDPGTLLLEYSIGNDASFLFAATGGELRVAKLCSAAQIRSGVERLRASITTPGRATLSNYLSSAAELYQELLEPVAGLLAGKKRLVIVPDGALYYLPFEVLLQKGGIEIADVPLSELPYLVRSFSVSYAPSVSVLEMLGRPAEQGAGTQSPPDDFIAFADPDYGNPDNGAEGGDEGGLGSLSSVVRGTFGFGGLWKLDRLPGSRIEVEQIAGLFPQGRSSLFLGAEATEENVKSPGRLGRYRYIHFAVHGLIDESQPQFTSLVLSPPSYEAGHWADKSGPLVREDGLLQAYEIFNLRLRADLVTLSACETGLGKQVKGEGLIGLSRAFFYAGAPSLLVSLWKVDDRSTASLMTSFYSRLRASAFGKPNDASKDGENGLVDSASKAGALREAKLKLIASGNFSHPYYWAPFILSGKP